MERKLVLVVELIIAVIALIIAVRFLIGVLGFDTLMDALSTDQPQNTIITTQR